MYDFQAAIDAAKAVVERNQESNSNKSYTYPLVYPQVGSTVVVRPLFNPKSGQILRLVNRHEKVACYRTYGIECPICKIMQQVKDLTGQDPFGRVKSSKSRGIAFAQFISSTIPISKGENKGNIQPGEIILFMFPWSVYQQINETIQAVSQTPTGMDQAFTHAASGLYIQVNVTPDFKYTTTPVPYLTFNPTNMSDDDFNKMLDGMESLYEQVLPSTVTEEVDKQVKEYEDVIYRQYIAPRTQQVGVPQGTVPQNFSQIPQNAVNQQMAQGAQYYPQTPTTPPVSTPAYIPQQVQNPAVPPVGDKPQCFGHHQPNNPTCICCPAEMMCLQNNG